MTDITKLVQFFPGLSREREWGTAPVCARGAHVVGVVTGMGKGEGDWKGRGKAGAESSVPLLEKGSWGAEGDGGSEGARSPLGVDDLDLGFASDGEGEGGGRGEGEGGDMGDGDMMGDGEGAGKSPGIFCPPPPFFAPPFPACIRNNFEDSKCCKMMGGCGAGQAPFGVKRHHWMFTAAFLSFVAFILLGMLVRPLSICRYHHYLSRLPTTITHRHRPPPSSTAIVH